MYYNRNAKCDEEYRVPSKADLFDFVSSFSSDDFRYLQDVVAYRVNQEK